MLNFIQSGKEIVKKSGGITWSSILATHFNFAQSDYKQITRIASSLVDIPNEIECLVRASPVNDYLDPDHCLGWVPSIVATLSVHALENPANNILSRISDADVSLIKICGSIIDKYRIEQQLDFDAVLSITKDVRVLIDSVQKLEESDLPTSAKRFLLHQLDLLERALIDCRLLGREVLHNSLADTWGRFRFNPKDTSEVKKTSVWEKYETILKRFVLVGASIAVAKSIGADFVDFLPEGTIEELEQAETESDDGNPGTRKKG